MALKVFHTGDLHIGMLYLNRNYPEEVRQQLVEARYQVLERMVERANEEECQLFIIAGDLFERLRVQEDQILKAAHALSRFGGVCAVLPGNHDYYTPGGTLWEKFREYSTDNTILLSDLRFYSLKDFGIDATLYPAPCGSKHSQKNNIQWISDLPWRPDTCWHLGLAHGSVEGYSPDFNQNYFPMKEEQLISTKLHFWFLGHTHVRIPDRRTFINGGFAYCGTPEPDGFDCSHGGSAWIISLDSNGNVEGNAIETGLHRFMDIERIVKEGEQIDDFIGQLSGEGKRTLMRLKLSGILPRYEYDNRHLWREAMKEKFLYLEWDDIKLQMEISRDTIEDLFPKGSFPYLLLDRLAEKGDQRALQSAYRLMKEVKK